MISSLSLRISTRYSNRLLTRAVKINHSKGLPDLFYRKDPEGAFVKKYHYRGSYGSHSVPLPLIVFPAHFFFSMLFARSTPSSETQGQIVRARESLNGRENMAQKKSKERREEPLGTMSYQTSSKRSPPFWLLIGARKFVGFVRRGFAPRSSPLPLNILFLTKGTSFVYLPLKSFTF